MLGNMIDTIKQSFRTSMNPPDPSRYNNPVALRTSWAPLKPGGTNFKTHNYVEERGEARFQPTVGALLFGGIFTVMGILFPIIALTSTQSNGGSGSSAVFILIPLIFSGVGIFMLRSFTTPIVFSKRKGYFWKGRVEESQRIERADLKVKCKLVEIEAVQVIAEWVRSRSSGSSGSGNSSYYSYEINLVLKDASRLNVVDYGNYRGVVDSAQKLSRYLNVPLWDATR